MLELKELEELEESRVEERISVILATCRGSV
jgi:hypothetical protein